MTAISFDSKFKYLQWNFDNNYGEIRLTDETIIYNDLQIDCDVVATCKIINEACTFDTPGSTEVNNVSVEIRDMKVFNEDGQLIKISAEEYAEMKKNIRNFIHTKL